MDIIRVVQNDVEVYTIVKNGASGMSQSGISRLVDEPHQKIGRIIKYLDEYNNTQAKAKSNKPRSKTAKGNIGKDYRNSTGRDTPLAQKWMSEQLEPFLGNVPTLAQNGTIDGKDIGNIKIYRHDLCGALVRHFAYQGNKVAQYSLDKFSDRGVLNWMHEITGWKPENQTQTYAEVLGIMPRFLQVEFDRHIFYNSLLNKDLSAPMYRVYLYLLDCNLINYRPTPEEVSKHAQVAKHNLYDLIERMRPHYLVPEWFEIDSSTRSLEAQILTRMQKDLDGQSEVQTIHGPIDLLTSSELIEIKKIEDWKEGFGQILAKCKTYPQHGKRLHLFGQSNRTLRNIRAACQPFDIKVTYENISLLIR